MMSGGNIHYEMSGKAEAITCGGIGAFHHLVRRVGLVKEIDRHLHLLKVHLPYHESDHVLNIAYNALGIHGETFTVGSGSRGWFPGSRWRSRELRLTDIHSTKAAMLVSGPG